MNFVRFFFCTKIRSAEFPRCVLFYHNMRFLSMCAAYAMYLLLNKTVGSEN